MADNISLNSGSGGANLAAASLTISGDTAVVQMVGCGILSGSEGSWVYSDLVGSKGAITAGTQRVTLGTDDNAVIALEKIDDWDESDRAKVNLIVGQAGIAAGAGAVGATVPRVTLASDDPAVALLGTIDIDTGVIAGDTTSIDGKITACNTGAVVISSSALPAGAATAAGQGTTNTHLGNIATNTSSALPSGDNNIGNVDIVTLPAANLGMQAMAASVSTVPASDITDATYIGDIKFGEALPAGTNAIGKLAANSGVDIGDVDVTSILAGTNTIGGTIAQASSSIVYDGTTACTVKRFHATTSTSDTSIITAVAGKKFRILSLSIMALTATATNVHLETKTTNTDCFGDSTTPIPLAVDADGDNIPGIVLPWNPGGWFETADANEDLAIILSAAQAVLICGNYIEVS